MLQLLSTKIALDLLALFVVPWQNWEPWPQAHKISARMLRFRIGVDAVLQVRVVDQVLLTFVFTIESSILGRKCRCIKTGRRHAPNASGLK
ncbi:uncharacterized protein UV8b_08290 [Ustilaginoidea virens]|uniref:Uncharacterized protein n=1 Tax=Ustilaginoidea virens TaxID=1159556 RepID=A0A8E5HYK9_USTVR|nr:uncharacterized protein UV8b_08290 [Ustilaginoidea virens]QUC24049.1 hypothetical protein UV8b_08290 [Ustilaginoidea virens]